MATPDMVGLVFQSQITEDDLEMRGFFRRKKRMKRAHYLSFG